MTTLSFLSTMLPPWAHRHQYAQVLPSPEAWPRAKPPGVPFFLVAFAHSRSSAVVPGNLENPAFLGGGVREFIEGAGVADRDVDPLGAGALAVGDRARHPAAVLLAEAVGDIGDVEALLREEMWQRIEAPEQVRAGTGVRRDRGLGLHVLVGLARDRHLDAGRLGESLHQLDELVVLRLHEVLPAQHRKRSSRLRLPGRVLGPGLRPIEQRRPGQCAGGGQRRPAPNEGTPREIGHGFLLACFPGWLLSGSIIVADVRRSSRRTDGRAVRRASSGWCRRA